MWHPNGEGLPRRARARALRAPRTLLQTHARRARQQEPPPTVPRRASPPPPTAVFPDGTLCLDIIQDKWKPIYTVEMILTSIQSLLCDPNNDSPANMDAAKMMRTDMKEYKKRVRRLAQKSVEG